MSTRKKVPNAEVAQSWLHAIHSSGVSFADWCAAEGVDGRSLHCWRRALAQRAARAVPLQLVELVAAPSAPPIIVSERALGIPSSLRVHVGDLVVEVFAGFDPNMLGGVVAVLRQC